MKTYIIPRKVKSQFFKRNPKTYKIKEFSFGNQPFENSFFDETILLILEKFLFSTASFAIRAGFSMSLLIENFIRWTQRKGTKKIGKRGLYAAAWKTEI